MKTEHVIAATTLAVAAVASACQSARAVYVPQGVSYAASFVLQDGQRRNGYLDVYNSGGNAQGYILDGNNMPSTVTDLLSPAEFNSSDYESAYAGGWYCTFTLDLGTEGGFLCGIGGAGGIGVIKF